MELQFDIIKLKLTTHMPLNPAVLLVGIVLKISWLDRPGNIENVYSIHNSKQKKKTRNNPNAHQLENDKWYIISSVHFSRSVVSSSLRPHGPRGSMPGFPVHHQLLEPTQSHVHHVGDAIQLSHPLLSP